jgi:hypothetical protein
MATVDTTKPQESQAQQYDVLPTDVYVMKIADAKREEDTFNSNKDGSHPIKLVITWEVDRLTEEQDESEVAVGTRVYQRMAPWYGITKDGAPSKYKAFVDGLLQQGLIEPVFDDEADLVGLVQRVSIEQYTKTMGANAGQPGNRVVSVMPLKRGKKAPTPPRQPAAAVLDDDSDLPF